MGLASLFPGCRVIRDGNEYEVAGSIVVGSGIEVKSLPTKIADTAYGEKAASGIWLLMFLESTDAEALAVPGGEEPGSLHLTVGQLDPATCRDRQHITNLISQAVMTLPPITGKIGGVGQFLTDGDSVPVVALFDSPSLNAWRDALLATLKSIGVESLSDHGYTPHVTLMYADRPLDSLLEVDGREIELPVLSLVWEGDRRDFQLIGQDVKGGPGSGHFGHAGRPGKAGGSSPASAGAGYGAAHALDKPTRMSVKGTLGLLEGGIVPKSSGMSLRERLFPGSPQRASAAMRDEQNRAMVKNEIVSTISQRTGVDPDKVSGVLKTWAETSKATPEAIELQKAAAEEFGLPMPELEPLLESSGEIPETSRSEMRLVLRAMYDETQRQLQERGIDSVVLYRGVKRDADFPRGIGDVITYRGNPVQSWSALWDVGFTFGDMRGAHQTGIVLAARIPAKMVMSTARTGLGCLGEYELVVFGDDLGSEALIISRSEAGSRIWEHVGE